MTTILHLDSTAKAENSVTKSLTARAMERLLQMHKGAKVIHRDLTANPLPHINPAFIGALFGGPAEGLAGELLALSDKLVAELIEADLLVIGAPMYNFSIPSQLKAWIDYVCRSGKTFKYTAEGSLGLLKNKKAIVAASYGGLYTSGNMAAYDHVVPYMRQILGFIGITDVYIARAEKQGMGQDVAAAEVASAEHQLDLILDKL